jgi:ATP-dependent DNA helicase DinG
LRLRQGMGRLIRTSEDKGSITIFLAENDQSILDKIHSILPVNPITG